MCSCVVNATSLRASGALVILDSFISEASEINEQFLIFIDDSLNYSNFLNIKFVKINKRSWLQRILWDFYGLNRWLNINGIIPKHLISLQNTTCNVKCSQIVYVHQGIMFSDYKFSFFKSEERVLYFYQNFYSYFIKLFSNKNTKFVVQTKNIKKRLVSDLDIDSTNVYISFPTSLFESNINEIQCDEKFTLLNESKFNLIYPSTPIFYKNHVVVLKAISYLKESRPDIYNKLVFSVTFNYGEYSNFDSTVAKLGIMEKINYLGVLPKENLFYLYQTSTALVFPSYIETLGLPLIEAAASKLPVICTDIPNTREVLDNYIGLILTDQNDFKAWEENIVHLFENVDDIKINISKNEWKFNGPGWDVLFKLLDEF